MFYFRKISLSLDFATCSFGLLLMNQSSQSLEGDSRTLTLRDASPPRSLSISAIVGCTELLIRWVITALTLVVAAWLVPGIRVEGRGWSAFAVMAIILGLVNAVIRPVLKLLSCPLIILTLGFFVLVIK